jgi:hypothetical protein
MNNTGMLKPASYIGTSIEPNWLQVTDLPYSDLGHLQRSFSVYGLPYSRSVESATRSQNRVNYGRYRSLSSIEMDTYINLGWVERLIQKSFEREGIGMTNPTIGLSEIRDWFDVEDEQALEVLLDRNAQVGRFLLEAKAHIERVFGNATVRIEVIDDSEFANEAVIFVVIFTDLSVEDALLKREELEATWFLKSTSNVKERFNFDVDWR